MNWLIKTFKSSIGLKFLMSLTGVGLVGFVLVHMVGNLQVLLGAIDPNLGQEKLNDYAHKLCGDLRKKFVRAEVDDSGDSLGKKIREGATSKIPNLFIVGQKEEAESAVSWKRHGTKEQTTLPFDQARDNLLREIAERTDWRRAGD